MNTQPKALWLANELEAMYSASDLDDQAAAELRRLHEVNQMLVDGLKYAVSYIGIKDSVAHHKVNALIAQVEGREYPCVNNDPDDMCKNCGCWKHTRAMCS